nr:MerR family transcriptional regulator [Lachnospiraceae bacterium]
MKAKDVLRILQITRPTLTKYVKEGKLKITVKGNGRYDYDADS